MSCALISSVGPDSDSKHRALSPVHNVPTACFVPSHQSTMSRQLVSCTLTSPQCPDSLFRALSPVHNVPTACFVPSHQSTMSRQLVSCPLTSPQCPDSLFRALSPVHNVLTACFVLSHQSTMSRQFVSCTPYSPQCSCSMPLAFIPVLHSVLTSYFLYCHQSTTPVLSCLAHALPNWLCPDNWHFSCTLTRTDSALLLGALTLCCVFRVLPETLNDYEAESEEEVDINATVHNIMSC